MIAPVPQEPSSDGTNGKDPKTGKFLPGNKLGKGGDPWAEKKHEFRAILSQTITREGFRDVIITLMDAAIAGESWAVKEVLDRVLGKATERVKFDADFTLNVVDFFRQVGERARLIG